MRHTHGSSYDISSLTVVYCISQTMRDAMLCRYKIENTQVEENLTSRLTEQHSNCMPLQRRNNSYNGAPRLRCCFLKDQDQEACKKDKNIGGRQGRQAAAAQRRKGCHSTHICTSHDCLYSVSSYSQHH